MTSRVNGLRTEVEFTLPKGYVDPTGLLHRQGVMRLATAADEILPLRDPRVQQNAAYLAVIVLARVIVKLGSLAEIDTNVIEGLYASDLDYLQRLYEEINCSEETDQRLDGSRPPAPGNGRLSERGGFGVVGEV
ncbi:hypothetical protein V1277_002845 [Bradyrhizobium sp. AZCC 1588]|uniref:hypothetical protein n=1 Tax=unclassified Bradyrhizobium TaxID=2631580 RepID=UPI002FEE9D4B